MNPTKAKFKNDYSQFRKKLRAINNIDEKVDFIIKSGFRAIYIKSKPFMSLKVSLHKDGILNPKLKAVKGPIFF